MMKKCLLLIFLMSLVSITSASYEDGKPAKTTVTVKVVDRYGEAVTGAKIMIRESGEIIYSDFDGVFQVQLEKNTTSTIVVEMIGFEPKLVADRELLKGELVLSTLQ
jgi:hypothetical protein